VEGFTLPDAVNTFEKPMDAYSILQDCTEQNCCNGPKASWLRERERCVNSFLVP